MGLRFQNKDLGSLIAVCQSENFSADNRAFDLRVNVIPEMSAPEIRKLFKVWFEVDTDKRVAKADLSHGTGRSAEEMHGLYLETIHVVRKHRGHRLAPQVMSAAVEYLDYTELEIPDMMYLIMSNDAYSEERRKFYAREGFSHVSPQEKKKLLTAPVLSLSRFLPVQAKKLDAFRGVYDYQPCMEGILD